MRQEKLARSSRWKTGTGKAVARRPVASVAWSSVTAAAKRTQRSRWGVGLSFESHKIAEAEAVISAEGNMCGTVKRGADALPESETTSRQKGTRRNLRGLTSGHRQQPSWSASGRRGAEADDART